MNLKLKGKRKKIRNIKPILIKRHFLEKKYKKKKINKKSQNINLIMN